MRAGPQGRGRPRGQHHANPARVAAAKALAEVEQGAHVEVALAPLLPDDPRDRGLAWYLALGTIRHRARVDEAIQRRLKQPLASLDVPVRAVLRVAAFEKLYSRTADHAVVDQGVETARAVGAGRASGLINAVLRRVAIPDDLERWQRLDHPSWLLDRWHERYGAAATEAWCEANNEPPPLFVVSRDGQAPFEGCEPAQVRGEVVPGVFRAESLKGRVEDAPGFADGVWWVQDAASAWMCDLVPADAARVLDACAAPGGKTLRLAARGADVVSVDRDPGRLDSLRESLERTGLASEVYAHDWTRGPRKTLGRFDAVLVDAPCTGLGTVRRHPEIRWRRGPDDPSHAAEHQREVLEGVWQHVKPGGALVYVVCTPEPEEGPELVAEFLADHPHITLELERTSAPPQGGEDAFYGARLRMGAL